MTLIDWFLFGSTFLIGLFVGMYVYLTAFVPEYFENQALEAVLDEKISTLRITGESYGGCQRAGRCASFELSGDRKYKYLPAITQGELVGIQSGRLPKGLFDHILNIMEKADLPSLAQSVNKQCDNWADGIDYKYTVQLRNDFYELDTCFSRLDKSSTEAVNLAELFVYMADPENYSSNNVNRGGLGGMLEERITDTFQSPMVTQ